MLEPFAFLQRLQERQRLTLQLSQLGQLLQTASHHVDILDAQELKVNIAVIGFVLVAFARCLVSHGIDLRACVNHVHEFRRLVRVHYEMKQLLVLHTPCVQAAC